MNFEQRVLFVLLMLWATWITVSLGLKTDALTGAVNKLSLSIGAPVDNKGRENSPHFAAMPGPNLKKVDKMNIDVKKAFEKKHGKGSHFEFGEDYQRGYAADGKMIFQAQKSGAGTWNHEGDDSHMYEVPVEEKKK